MLRRGESQVECDQHIPSVARIGELVATSLGLPSNVISPPNNNTGDFHRRLTYPPYEGLTVRSRSSLLNLD
jgi:hypothetical protein